MAGNAEANGYREDGRPVLEAEVRRWAQIPWEQVVSLLRESQRYEATLEKKKYRVEVGLVKDTEAHVLFSVAVEDCTPAGSMPALCRRVALSKTTRRERRKLAR
jgi:hypothetical protein